MSIRVVIADDHDLVRVGLVTFLEGTDIEVVGEAATASEAIAVAVEQQPDVVLLDVRMDGEDGLEALFQIKQKLPETQVVVLSAFDNPTYVARSAALGASDYILKATGRKELIDAIRAAAAGSAPTSTGLLQSISAAMASRHQAGKDIPLTNRESQVLRHIALGLSNKEIARSLEISVETVKEHVQNILRKVSVWDRTQAAVWAVRQGLV